MKWKKLSKTFILMFAICCCIFFQSVQVKAGTQSFEMPRSNPTNGEKIDFKNGSFENPDLTTLLPEDPLVQELIGRGQTAERVYIYDAGVEGWNTIPVEDIWSGTPEERFINTIEIQRRNTDTMFPVSRSFPWMDFGPQWAELNAALPGRLYQEVATIPGQKLYYEFYHKGRDGEDVMNFYLRSPSDSTNAGLIGTYATNKEAWQRCFGAYVVPMGQTTTQFSYESVSATIETPVEESLEYMRKIYGNYLDGIRLFYPSFFELTKSLTTSGSADYVLPGDTITYTIQIKNTGETESSRTIFSDVLPNGVEYVDGSTKVNGSAASTLTSFDAVSDTLSVKIGRDYETEVDPNTLKSERDNAGGTLAEVGGAVDVYNEVTKENLITITFDVLVTGEGLEAGELIKNQAKVTYNDLGFEEYNHYVDDSNVSNVVEIPLKCFGEVNGIVWADTDYAGTITAGERRIGGEIVEIVDASGNVVNDMEGNPLTTTTDSDGSYSFRNIPFGTHYIRYYRAGYQVTIIDSGENGNKAQQSATYAMIGSLEFKQSDLNAADLYKIVYNHQNIGVLPILSISKSGEIDGVEDAGTAAARILVKEADTLYYLIKVTNHALNEDDRIENIQILDTIPDGLIIQEADITPSAGLQVSGQNVTWMDQNLPAGTTIYKIPVKMGPYSVTSLKHYDNQALLTAVNRNDQTLTSNTTYHKAVPAIVILTKTAVVTDTDGEEFGRGPGSETNPEKVYYDQNITYEITAQNTGDNGIQGFEVKDTIPEGLILDQTSGVPAGMLVETEGTTQRVIWENQTLDVGESKTYRFTVTIDVEQIEGYRQYINTALIEEPANWDSDNYPFQDSNTTYHEVVSADFIFMKEDENGDPMNDVVFELYTCTLETVEGHVHSAIADNSSECCWDINNPYQIAVSGENGKAGEVVFPYLSKGEYMLVETQTLSGYQLPLGQWLIIVERDGALSIEARGEAPPAFKKETVDGEIIYRLPNYRAFRLPATGGIGKILGTVMGSMSLSLAAMYILSGRRKKRKNSK